MLKIFGAVGSGSVPIEAALTLLGTPYEVIEAVTWESEEARKRVEMVNPLRQVPALVLPSGEIVTESAAILIYLADLHPQARLAPGLNDTKRAQYLRWMATCRRPSTRWPGSRTTPCASSPAKKTRRA